jgi:carboxymethylenebutenolidase
MLPIRSPLIGQSVSIQDESSKGRWDAALTSACFTFMMELFNRTIGRDLGPREGAAAEVEHVC